MICYFDASAFVKLLLPEAGSKDALDLWTRADRIVSSLVLYPEGCSALTRAARSGRVRRARHIQARRVLERFWRSIDRVPVDTAVAGLAGDIAEQHALKALDAVHIASATSVEGPDLVFVASDHALIGAARQTGLVVAPV